MNTQLFPNPNLSRLKMFENALSDDTPTRFFITANSVADYSDFIAYPLDEDGSEDYSTPNITDNVWYLCNEYQQQ